MKTTRILAGLMIVGLLAAAAPCFSKVLRVFPDQSAAATTGGMAMAALRFNLGSTPSDIKSAYLEWTLTGIPTTRRSEYFLYVPESSWSTSTDVRNLSLPDEPLAAWDIEVRDYERAGGFVRFDLTDLVREWRSGGRSNHGVVMVTPDLTASSLSGQLSNPRLVVR